MKTKIIYISGSEIFNISDIRNAFEEVRNALQLGPDTVLFGVPVDQEDAGFGTESNTSTDTLTETTVVTNEIIESPEVNETIESNEPAEPIVEIKNDKPKQKRGRTRKNIEPENVTQDTDNDAGESDVAVDKIVPILSVLSTNDEDSEIDTGVVDDIPVDTNEEETIDTVNEETEVLELNDTDVKTENIITEIDETPEMENRGEPDLEKLLSEMTPLQEDIREETSKVEEVIDSDVDPDNVDATLEQLATEFAEAQDKIISETKSSGRGKIGKLRNILPFKQSKHKDQGLGDLFGWAGVAANDEEFSVPGFFTNVSSKK